MAIGVAGLAYLYLTSGLGSFQGIGLAIWGGMDSFTLTAIPLFILMAEFLLQGGLSLRVYRGLSRIVRRLPGGLLQTNIAGCAIFAAITGSSVATAASIGTVALPELLRRSYNRHLSVGMFMIYVGLRAAINPSLAPRSMPSAKEEDGDDGGVLATMNDILPFVVLIGVVLGSLYLGYATPTESAAVGSALSAVIALIWGNLDPSVLCRIFWRAIRVSGSILAVVFAAYIFSYAVSLSGLGSEVAAVVGALSLSRFEFLAVLFAFYTLLGCVVDSISMIVITIPILYPVLTGYGFDGIWFGVVLVLLIELGQITPPMGLNLFVIQGVWSGRLEEVVRGVVPFYAIIILMIGILTLWPSLALWLPAHMAAR